MRYKVLRDGLLQRVGTIITHPRTGDTIVVSDIAAPRLLRRGFIETINDVEEEGPRCPEHPRYRGKTFPREDCDGCRALYDALHKEDS